MICSNFYFYHNELICQCVQEKANCCAILEQCENPIGRKSYLQEEEDKDDF